MVCCLGLNWHITVWGWAREFIYSCMKSISLIALWISSYSLAHSCNGHSTPCPCPSTLARKMGLSIRALFVFFLRESVSGAKRIETKKANRDSILNLPPPPSTPWHFFGPQFLWLKRIPFTLGSCLAIAATRLGFVRGIWQERGKINRGDFSYFLCPICPLPLITYTHRQTPISLIWKRRCFSSTFWVHSRYTHLSVGLPLHPGREILEERKSTPHPPHIHTPPPGLLLLWVLFFFFNLPATTDFQSSAACILSRVFSYIQWEGWGRVCLLPNLNQNPVNYLLTLYFMVPVWWWWW